MMKHTIIRSHRLVLLGAALLSIAALAPQPSYFADLEVVETVSRRLLTVSEVMELLDRQPNVKTVVLHCDPPRRFSIETLAYPQYANRYMLTKEEWAELQRYCTERLKEESPAAAAVKAHWQAIAAGTPPFGLRVQSE